MSLCGAGLFFGLGAQRGRWGHDQMANRHTQFTLCSGEGGTIRKRRETGWALGAEGGHKVKIIIGKIHEVDMELL